MEEKDLKLIKLCEYYAKDPFGASNHHFMMLVNKLSKMLDWYKDVFDLLELAVIDESCIMVAFNIEDMKAVRDVLLSKANDLEKVGEQLSDNAKDALDCFNKALSELE